MKAIILAIIAVAISSAEMQQESTIADLLKHKKKTRHHKPMKIDRTPEHYIIFDKDNSSQENELVKTKKNHSHASQKLARHLLNEGRKLTHMKFD